MTPSSAQRLGQSTIRSLRANVAGTRASSQGTRRAGIGGFRGICLPFPNELPRRYLWYGETRNGAGSGAPRARHEKKAPATTPLIHTTSRGNSLEWKIAIASSASSLEYSLTFCLLQCSTEHPPPEPHLDTRSAPCRRAYHTRR
jgi:hypothetical protein